MDKEKTIRKGFVQSVYNYLDTIVQFVVSFIVLIIISRLLSVEEYGVYSIILTMSSFVILFSSFGIPAIINRYIPEFLEKKNFLVLKRIIKNSVLIRFLVITVSFALLFAFQGNISSLLNVDLSNYIFLLGVLILLLSSSEMFENILAALIEQRYKTLSKIISYSIHLPLSYYLLIKGFGVYGLILSLLVLNGLLSILFITKVYSRVFHRKTGGSEEGLFKRMYKYGLYLYFVTVGEIFLNVYLDNFVISIFLGAYHVGLYNFSYKIAQYLNNLSPGIVILPVIFPIVVQKYTSKKSPETLNHIFQFYSRLIAFFIVPVTIIFLLVSDKAVSYIFSPKYLPGLGVLNLFLVFFMLWSFIWPVSIMIRTLEKVKITFLSRIFIVYNLVMDLLLVPLIGIEGAALATGSTLVFILLFQFFMLRREMKFSYPWKSLGKISLNSIIASAAVIILSGFIVDLISLISVSVLSFGFYIALSRVNRVFRKDDELLEKMSRINVLRYL